MPEITRKKYSYSHEIETILTQFIALIDKCIVHRYEKNPKTFERTITSTVYPKYSFGSKSRVLYFLENKAKNITYPVVVISISSIKMDNERLMDKWKDIYRKVDNNTIEIYSKPVPLEITLKVSIISTMQTDLYQIFGHIATKFQPSQFYSWCVPGTRENNYEEQRNKVTWDGSFNIETKDKLQESDEEIYRGDMNFTVEGWLYPAPKENSGEFITDIGTTLTTSPDTYYRTTNECGEYLPFVIGNDTPPSLNPREWANNHPRIMLAYLIKAIKGENDFNEYSFGVNELSHNVFDHNKEYILEMHGYNLSEISVLLLPDGEMSGLETHQFNVDDMFPKLGTKDPKNTVIKGKSLEIIEQGDNMVRFKLPQIEYTGRFDIAVCSKADYDSLNNAKGFKLTAI